MAHLFALTLVLVLALTGRTEAQAPPDFNKYILRAITEVVAPRKGGGYDINKAFTQDLEYGADKVRASQPRLTMCVAAVAEIIIEAMNLYARENGPTVIGKIPVSSWSKGHLAGLRANIFMYAGTGSRGTGHTLERFKLGTQLRFNELKAGDFINLNRTTGNGHAVVFLGYLDRNSNLLPSYSNQVVGFRYFSAQGKGRPDAGLAYRNAYFDGFCPESSAEFPRDCKIIRSENRALLNMGRMYDPSAWKYDEAVAEIKAGVRSAFESAYPGETRAFTNRLADLEVNRELEPRTEIENFFDGVTAD